MRITRLNRSACAIVMAFSAIICSAQTPEQVQSVKGRAAQGEAEAQTILGMFYYLGGGVPKDFAQAVSWWRKAADQGLAEAQFHLGLMYRDGEGVPADRTEAARW
ncbi:MAG TPA: tetratricopeptide repeat protein, partial [Candidatus Sulfotelmatobacter sp.]